MEPFELDDMRVRRRKQTITLIETQDLTKQLLQAAERHDQVSVQMLLSMRQEPVLKLQEQEEGILQRLREIPEKDAIRLNELLYGDPPRSPEEKPLSDQVAQYRRLLENVVQMDKMLSVKLGGRRSFYNTFRDG